MWGWMIVCLCDGLVTCPVYPNSHQMTAGIGSSRSETLGFFCHVLGFVFRFSVYFYSIVFCHVFPFHFVRFIQVTCLYFHSCTSSPITSPQYFSFQVPSVQGKNPHLHLHWCLVHSGVVWSGFDSPFSTATALLCFFSHSLDVLRSGSAALFVLLSNILWILHLGPTSTTSHTTPPTPVVTDGWMDYLLSIVKLSWTGKTG